MSRPIHGKSTAALKFLRKKPAALAVYWCYVARSNRDGVAWPSGDGLARDTGWDKATCLEGRALLVELKALEKVEKYVRPQWRELTGKALAQRINLDRSEYYRPLGGITVNGKDYDLLYIGGNDHNDIDETTHGVSRPPTKRTDMRQDTPELDLSTSELVSNELPVAPVGSTVAATVPDAKPTDEDPLTWRRIDDEYPDLMSKSDPTYDTWANGITSKPVDEPRKLPAGYRPNPNSEAVNALVNGIEADAAGKPPSEFEMMLQAVAVAIGMHGESGKPFAKMLMGMSGKGEYNMYKFAPPNYEPVTPTELHDWSAWYDNANRDPRTGKTISRPRKPMLLHASILEYRAAGSPTAAKDDAYSAFVIE